MARYLLRPDPAPHTAPKPKPGEQVYPFDHPGDEEAEYRSRLKKSMVGAIRFAQRRQEERARKGKPPVPVTVTLPELLAKLEEQTFVCALTGLRFYGGKPNSYSPRRPSLDRIDDNGPYVIENVRIVLLGVNMLRGTSDDTDMFEVASALLRSAGATATEG